MVGLVEPIQPVKLRHRPRPAFQSKSIDPDSPHYQAIGKGMTGRQLHRAVRRVFNFGVAVCHFEQPTHQSGGANVITMGYMQFIALLLLAGLTSVILMDLAIKTTVPLRLRRRARKQLQANSETEQKMTVRP